jgi:hypothetical protein
MNKIVFQADKIDLSFSFKKVPELQILQISRKLIFLRAEKYAFGTRFSQMFAVGQFVNQRSRLCTNTFM